MTTKGFVWFYSVLIGTACLTLADIMGGRQTEAILGIAVLMNVVCLRGLLTN